MAGTTAFPGNSLPAPRTSLIGREVEREMARAFLLDAAVPLLTLTGPGGVGKTRLALTIAADVALHFADGVIWVDLTAVQDADMVASTVATAISVTSGSSTALEQDLLRALQGRQILLLLDNCEQVLGGVASLVGRLLARSPAVQVLATSRAPIQVRGEQRLPIEPLALPPTDHLTREIVMSCAAIQLFRERALAVRPGFTMTDATASTVTQLCQHLDGLPLAIELAAARMALLTPEQLLVQMSDRLRVLRGGDQDLPDRHQTMTATIAWSCDLLTTQCQVLFRRLAVFTGGFTLDAAVAVAADVGVTSADVLDELATLVTQSLVIPIEINNPHEPRFTMLETIRAFGLAQLAISGDERQTRQRHASWFHRLVVDLDLLHANVGDETWFPQITREQANLRQTLTWFVEQGNGLALNDLSAGLFKFWYARSLFTEGRHWLETAMVNSTDVPVVVRSRVASGAGFLAGLQGDVAAAAPMIESGLALAEQSGDAIRLSEALLEAGVLAAWQRDFARAIATNEAAEQAAPNPLLQGTALSNQGWFRYRAGDVQNALPLLDAAIQLLRAPGGTWSRSGALLRRGSLRLDQDVPGAALDLLESVALCWERGDLGLLVLPMRTLAEFAARSGQPAAAAEMLGAADALARQIGRDGVAAASHQERIDRCLALLRPHLETTAITTLRQQGERYALPQMIALAREIVRSVHGEEAVEAIWRATGAPDPGEVRRDGEQPMMAVGQGSQDVHTFATLTRRERDVLRLLCQRLTDLEIAERLFISPLTVGKHVSNVLGKLGVTNRRDAAAVAVRHGLA